MAENFYTVLTNVGLAAIANAQITQSKVDFSTFVVGDSNGSYYNPTAGQSSLVNEVWRGPISGISIDENNPNWVVIEAAIPGTAGGFSVREIGVLDTDGNLLAIGKVPETYKPASAEGSLKDLYLRMILEVSNASVVTLKIDPAVAFASKKYVDDQITINIKPLQNHINDKNVHTTLVEKDKWNANVTNLATHKADLVKHGVYGVATGTNTLAMTVPIDASIASYPTGMLVAFKNTTANTGAVTLNVNGLGAKSISKAGGDVLAAGNLKAGGVYHCRYDGTNFFLLGEGGEYGNATASQVLSPYTIGTENGLITGTIPTKSAQTFTPGRTNQTIAAGQYLSGAQTILGDTDLKPENINKGTNIFNVVGNLTPEPFNDAFASRIMIENNFLDLYSTVMSAERDSLYQIISTTAANSRDRVRKVDLLTFKEVWSYEFPFTTVSGNPTNINANGIGIGARSDSLYVYNDDGAQQFTKVIANLGNASGCLTSDMNNNLYMQVGRYPSWNLNKYDSNGEFIYSQRLQTNVTNLFIFDNKLFGKYMNGSFVEFDNSDGSVIRTIS